MRVSCPAKVNLYLNALKKRKDGFHEIESIFHAVALCDYLTLSKSPRFNLEISSQSKIPKKNFDQGFTKNNLLKKVFDYFQKHFSILPIKIILEKNIPLGAGLGGGSSNVAGLIFALNKLFNLKLSIKKQMEIGDSFGSDVAFFFQGGMALVSGKGEKIEKLPISIVGKILITYPDISISTVTSYQFLNTINPNSNYRKIKKQLYQIFNSKKISLNEKRNTIYQLISRNHYNNFQEKTFEKYPLLEKIQKDCSKISPFSMMSGSGSSLFMISHDIINLESQYFKLVKEFTHTHLVNFISTGVKILKTDIGV